MKIFVSHAAKETEFARDLSVALTQAGLCNFFAADSIGNERWKPRIETEVELCNVALFVLSEAFVTSMYPMEELCLFMESSSHKYLAPLFFGLSVKEIGNQDVIETWSKESWSKWPKRISDNCRNALDRLMEWNERMQFSHTRQGESAYIKSIVGHMDELSEKIWGEPCGRHEEAVGKAPFDVKPGVILHASWSKNGPYIRQKHIVWHASTSKDGSDFPEGVVIHP